MLYLIYGTSAVKRHETRDELFKKNQIKHADVISKAAHESSVAELEQLSGASLFGEKLNVSFEYPFLNEVFGGALLARSKELVDSPNSIFVIERELTKDIVKAFEKSGAHIFLCDEPKEAKKKMFNVFSITDAFAARDKKGAWLLYREAVEGGESPEAVVGILFWMIKSLLSKKRFFKWKQEELEHASRELVRIVHEAHNGLFDLEEELERFLLKTV